MKKIKSILKDKLMFVPVLVFGAFMIVLAGFNSKVDQCESINIYISNNYDNYFLEEEDVLNILTVNGDQKIVGKTFSELDLKILERKLLNEKYVKEAQVYKILQGKLIVDVVLRRPLARIIRANAPDAYISEDKIILPVSEKFTARKILISGQLADSLTKGSIFTTDYGRDLFEFIDYINKDKFWAAQIAQVDIDNKGMLTLYPQVTKQEVDFGSPKNYKDKLKKLNAFYEMVLPRKGWNHYEKVDLKFENQIIAK